jgi:pre-rRNA-processing protein TSR1
VRASRWIARPIFSELALNSDRQKYERWLQPARWACASALGPITFAPSCPVLLLREVDDGPAGAKRLELVASGSLLAADSERVILKRATLTGFPIRNKKRKAVVRRMFDNPDDVRYFKEVGLVTKHGITAHIKEPVGTHGLFKVVTSRPIKAHDTICLNLWKRIFPKFDDTDRVTCV